MWRYSLSLSLSVAKRIVSRILSQPAARVEAEARATLRFETPTLGVMVVRKRRGGPTRPEQMGRDNKGDNGYTVPAY